MSATPISIRAVLYKDDRIIRNDLLESRGASKDASPVRRGDDRKGSPRHLAGGLRAPCHGEKDCSRREL